jgi:hypothetical protein
MLSRTLARLLTAAALLAASGAWTGWVFLRTAADPGRGGQLAQAVLADPAARQELVKDIAGPVAGAANRAIASAFHGAVPVSVSSTDPRLVAAVETTLADPRFAAEISTALQTAQTNLLGGGPAKPVVVNGDLAELAARNYVTQVIGTDAAARLPVLHLAPISVNTPRVPALAKARSLAETWDVRLWIVAAIGLAAAFALGSRPRVLRSAGAWAIGSGLFAVVLPKLVRYAATRYVPSNAGIAQVAVRQLGGSVGAAGMTLVVVGALAFAAGMVWDRLEKQSLAASPALTAPAAAQPVRAPLTVPATATVSSAARRFGVVDAAEDGRPSQPIRL